MSHASLRSAHASIASAAGLLSLLLATLATPSPARAQEPPPEVKLPLAQYEALMAHARTRGGPEATWATGTATVRLPESGQGAVAIEVAAELEVVGAGRAEVVLLPAHVILEEASLDGQSVPLVRRDGAHVALIEGPRGRVAVRLRYQVPIQPSSDGANVVVAPLPPLPGVRVDVAQGGVTSPVEVWPSGAVTSPSPNLVVQLPATSAMVLRWGSSAPLVRRVDYRITIDPGNDGATIEARIEAQLEGPRAMVPLLPANVALTEVEEDGKPLPTRVAAEWHQASVSGPGRHVLTASFRTGIDRSQGQPQVTLPLAPAPILKVEAIVPGRRSVTFDPAVPLTVSAQGDETSGTTTAVGFLTPSPRVVVSWTEPRTAPEQITSVNTETYQLVKIEEGVLRSKVAIRYEIIRGTLKELPIQLPEQAVLYKVHGDGIEDWRTFAATEADPRQARVFLGAERDGVYELELELEQVAPQTVGQPLDIPIVRPLGAGREMGVVALFDGDKVGFGEAEAAGYVRSGEDALPVEVRQKLPGDIVSQAYKHLGAPGAVRSQVAAAKTRETRYDAHVESLYTFQQNALTVNSSITIDVKSGRTDRIVLSLPRGVKVGSDVSAPSLKKADWVEGQDANAPRQDYEIVLTRALEGTFRIELSLELILGSELAKLPLPDIQLSGADVKKGDLGITADPGMEVTQSALTGLRKLDSGELPNSIKLRSRREVQLGYSFSYVDEPWSLELDVRRHRTIETLTAQIQQAWVTTSVLEEGEIVHQVTYRIENKDRPYLRVTLPAGARPLGVSVAGERVDPIADESGALKIQLPKQQVMLVELAFMTKRDPIGLMAALELDAPRTDLFQTDLQWLVRLPADLTLMGTSSALAERPTDEWRGPPEAGAGAVSVRLPPSARWTERLFTLDVLDASSEAALRVNARTLSTPGWVGPVLTVLALLLLAIAVLRGVRRETRRASYRWALAGGLALLVLKAVGWGLSGGEGVVLVVALALVALGAWIQRKGTEAA